MSTIRGPYRPAATGVWLQTLSLGLILGGD
eukprot:COSAG01_NODE_3346_length_6219_cov_12.199804_1_plen_29_part_10